MSVQLNAYLQARADGTDMEFACQLSGIPVAEARLYEADIEAGERVLPPPNQPKECEMAKKTKAGDGPTNLSETKDIVRNAVPKIVNLMERRKALNADIAEIRETVNAAGVPKKALDHAIKVKQMDPDVRAAFDEGYAIARDAIGLRMSASLFDMIETPTEAPVPAANGADATADAAA